MEYLLKFLMLSFNNLTYTVIKNHGNKKKIMIFIKELHVFFFSDKVYPLPQNWPRIPQIFRRKSCELTKNSSPCVNKAVSHLELIQGIIEEWFKEKEEECKDQSVPIRPGISSQIPFKYNRPPPPHYSILFYFHSHYTFMC